MTIPKGASKTPNFRRKSSIQHEFSNSSHPANRIIVFLMESWLGNLVLSPLSSPSLQLFCIPDHNAGVGWQCRALPQKTHAEGREFCGLGICWRTGFSVCHRKPNIFPFEHILVSQYSKVTHTYHVNCRINFPHFILSNIHALSTGEVVYKNDFPSLDDTAAKHEKTKCMEAHTCTMSIFSKHLFSFIQKESL